MNIVDRLGVSEEKRDLMMRINSNAGVADVPGYVVLDDSDHQGFANRRYSSIPAFYMNIALGGPEGVSPNYILELMSRNDCEHFLWISRREAEAPLSRFAWIYAHEIQHLVQELTDPLCARANNLIQAAYRRLESTPKLQLEFPSEFDAELAARNAVRDLLGPASVAQFIDGAASTPSGQIYFERFREIEANWCGLRQATQAILAARRDELLALQRELATDEYQFDIDRLCNSGVGDV